MMVLTHSHLNNYGCQHTLISVDCFAIVLACCKIDFCYIQNGLHIICDDVKNMISKLNVMLKWILRSQNCTTHTFVAHITKLEVPFACYSI